MDDRFFAKLLEYFIIALAVSDKKMLLFDDR